MWLRLNWIICCYGFVVGEGPGRLKHVRFRVVTILTGPRLRQFEVGCRCYRLGCITICNH